MSTRQFPRIKVVRAYVTEPGGDQGADCHDVADEHWINGHPHPVANPMSGYELYQKYRKSWGINALGTMVVEVRISCLLFFSRDMCISQVRPYFITMLYTLDENV